MAAGSTQGVRASGAGAIASVAMARAVRDGAQPLDSLMVPARLARIPAGGDLDASPLPLGFGQDAQDALGDLGTETDGWHDLFNVPALALNGDVASLDPFSTIMQGVDGDLEGWAVNNWDTIAGPLGQAQADGDSILSQFSTDVSPPSPPPPPPPPQPPSGGGGPVGGGGGGGGGPQCLAGEKQLDWIDDNGIEHTACIDPGGGVVVIR